MSPHYLDYFTNAAEAYRRFRPSWPPELYRWLADHAPGRELAIDCGAGNGQAAAGVSHYFARVVAVEADPAQAACRLPVAGVEFLNRYAEDTGLPSGQADLVMAAQAAHRFELPAFLEEAARLLRPGGLLALWGYHGLQLTEELDPILHALHDEALSEDWGPEHVLTMGEYRSIELPWADLPTPEITMRVLWTCDELLGFIETWSASERFRQRTGTHVTASVEADVRHVWGDMKRRELRLPLHLRACRRPLDS